MAGGHGGHGSPAPKKKASLYGLAEDIPGLGLEDFDAAVEEQKKAERSRSLQEGLFHSAALIRGENPGVLKPSSSIPDPVRNYVMKRGLAAQDQQAQVAAVENPDDDPASPVSQATRAALLKTPTGKAIADSLGGTWDSLPASKLKPFIPMYRASGDENPDNEAAPPDWGAPEGYTKKQAIQAGFAKRQEPQDGPLEPEIVERAARLRIPTTGRKREPVIADILTAERAAAEKREQKERPTTPADLRREFQSLPVVKDMQQVATSFEKIAGSSETGAGDIALIFNFMKMLDPGSTVREGEFATAASTGAVPDRVLHFYKKLDGDKLPPSARAQLKDEARRVFEVQRGRYDAAAGQYRRLAGDAADDVVLDLGYGAMGAGAAPAGAPPPARPSGLATPSVARMGAPAPARPAARIRVVSPEGRRGTIAPEELESALAAGWRRVE